MYAELPYRQYEQLIEVIEKMKNSRKKSFARKVKHINPTCIIQNDLRKRLIQIKPNTMQAIEDNYTGIDYVYNNLKIDQKFSFGDLGENAIIIRTKNRRLLNASDWTMIINREERAEFFETTKLAEFVKKNWGIVAKNFIEKTIGHEKYKIQLSDFYKNENIKPITVALTKDELIIALNQICTEKDKVIEAMKLFPLICELRQ